MLAKLLKMQKQMRETRADLAGETVTATAADGDVVVTVSGDQRVQEIYIAHDLFENGDSENLGDVLVAAINDAIEKSQTLAARRLEQLTSGLGLPGK
jgi:hypothetical protein